MSTASDPPSSSKRKRRHVTDKRREPSGTAPEISPAEAGDNDNDEIRLLLAFLQITKESPSPHTAAATLFERVGKSLSVEITHSQLIDKLKKLRNNYAKQSLNKDSIKTLSPLEKEIFEISHEIWGGGEAARGSSNGCEKVLESSNKKKKKEKEKEKEVIEVETLDEGENVRVKRDSEDVVDLEKKYAFLMEEVSRLSGNNEATMKEGLKLMNGSELERLNRKWRSQQIKEAKFVVSRDRFVGEVKGLILEGMQGGSRG